MQNEGWIKSGKAPTVNYIPHSGRFGWHSLMVIMVHLDLDRYILLCRFSIQIFCKPSLEGMLAIVREVSKMNQRPQVCSDFPVQLMLSSPPSGTNSNPLKTSASTLTSHRTLSSPMCQSCIPMGLSSKQLYDSQGRFDAFVLH